MSKKTSQNTKQDSEQNEAQATVFDATKLRNKKPSLLLVVGIAFIVIGAILVLISMGGTETEKEDNVLAQELCQSNVTAQHLREDNIEELEAIVADITSDPTYIESTDCLYVLTSFYVRISDYANAEEYYSPLKPKYASVQDLNVSLQSTARNPEELEIVMQELKFRTEKVQENSSYGPQVDYAPRTGDEQ